MYQDDMDMWEWEQEHGSQDGLFDPMKEEMDLMNEVLDDEDDEKYCSECGELSHSEGYCHAFNEEMKMLD